MINKQVTVEVIRQNQMKNRLENSNINTFQPNDVGTVPMPTITIEEDELEKMKRECYMRAKQEVFKEIVGRMPTSRAYIH